MAIPPLTIHRPKSVADALGVLQEAPSGQVITGGTDLVVALKNGLRTPHFLVDVTSIPGFGDIRETDEGLLVGAGASLAAVCTDIRVQQTYTALAEAARSVGSPQLREMGTLGGNICLDTRCYYYNRSRLWRAVRGPCLKTGGASCLASPSSRRCFAVMSADTVPALAALAAVVRVERLEKGTVRARQVPLSALYCDEGRSHLSLDRDEIVTAVLLPRPIQGSRSGYAKFRLRRSIDFPLASVSALVQMEDGVLRHARVYLGAVASAPVQANNVLCAIENSVPTEEVLRHAARSTAQAAHPVPNLLSSVAQRRQMVDVLTFRLLSRLTAN